MASIDALKASDGSGNASVVTIQASRSAGATTIQGDTVQGLNNNFFATMGTPHTFTDPVTGETITIISEETAVDFKGHVDGSDLEIDTIAPGYVDNGSEVGDIVVIRPTTQWADEVAEILEVAHEDDGSLKDSVFVAPIRENLLTGGGWISLEDYTLVYVSATTFKIVGQDVTALFPKGAKLKLSQTSTKYFYVIDSDFTTDTTITITGGSDYSLANAAITAPYISYGSAPQGFPDHFNYTPSWTNFTPGSATIVAKFTITGKTVDVYLHVRLNGSTMGDVRFTLPTDVASFYATTGAYRAVNGMSHSFDASGGDTMNILALTGSNQIRMFIGTANSTYVTFSNHSSTAPWTWANTDEFAATLTYMM